jgi:hypothetical protein
MKYFSSALTKDAFTLFTTLTPNSTLNQGELEIVFHEQFFKRETKLSVVDLTKI